MSSPHTPNYTPETPSNEKKEQILKTALSQAFSDYSKERVEHLHALENFLLWNDTATDAVKKAVRLRFLDHVKNHDIDVTQRNEYIEHIHQWPGRDLARRLVMEYNNLKESARKKAENWFDFSDATQKKAFLDIQNGLSLKDLTTSMLSSAHMAQIIERASNSALILKKKDDANRIDDMFARLKIQADQLSPEEQEEMREAAELYITAGVITQEFIRFALKSLDTSASDYESNVQALVQEFLPTISVYEMRQYGVLPHERLEAMALESYRASLQRIQDRLGTTPTEPAYNPGSSDEVFRNTPEFQDFYMNFISSENRAFHYQFSTEWLKFEEIEKLFLQNDQAIQRFASLIESKIDTENKRRFETFDAMKYELISGNFLTDEEKNKIRGSGTPDEVLGQDIRPNHFITFSNDSGIVGMWKILETESENEKTTGIRLLKMTLEENDTGIYKWTGKENSVYVFPYGAFAKGLKKELGSASISEVTFSSEEPADIELSDALRLDTLANFQRHIDEIDPEYKDHVFDVGCTFSVRLDSFFEMVTVQGFDEAAKTITLRLMDGNIFTMSWLDFIYTLEVHDMQLHRLGNVDSAENFANNARIPMIKDSSSTLAPIIGMVSDNGVPSMFNAADNKNVPIWGFQDEKGNDFFQVEFWATDVCVTRTRFLKGKEFDAIEEAETGKKKKKPENPSDKEKSQQKMHDAMRHERRYEPQKMSYMELIQRMQEAQVTTPVVPLDHEGKYDASVNPVENRAEEVKQENDGGMEDNPKAAGGLFRVSSVGEMYYKLKHRWEYFKKGWEWKSEKKQAYAFINMPWVLGAAGVDSVANLVNTTMDNIKKMYMGIERRKEIRKILEGKKPYQKLEFHNVAAGIMLTLEMAGHLYPDSHLQDLQGEKYLWFEKLCQSMGLNPREQYIKCRAKVIDGKPEIAHRPPEEAMIERLLKMNQENKYVQALGGGAKMWKLARQWRSEQREKGKAESNEECSTEQSRADYVVSKMESNEFEIALGGLSELIDKSTSPDVMGVAFAVAAGNAPNYVHNDTLDKMKNTAFGGVPFHAFWFVRSKEYGDIYKHVLRSVLEYRSKNGMSGANDMLQDYNRIAVMRDARWPYAHNGDVYKELWNFWKKHHSVLHMILQGTDPTLQIMLGDTDVDGNQKIHIKKYLQTLHGWSNWYLDGETMKKHAQCLSYGTYDLDSSFLFTAMNKEDPRYHSLNVQFSTMSFNPQTATLDGDDREKILKKQIIPYFRHLRDHEMYRNNPEHQKQQFMISYVEIMGKLAEKTVPALKQSEAEYERLKKTDYLKHLKLFEEFGFDMSYHSMMRKVRGETFHDDAEEVYEKFVRSSTGITGLDRIRERVQKNVSDHTFTAGNDDEYRVAA